MAAQQVIETRMNPLSSVLQIHVGTIEIVLGVLFVLFGIGVAWGRMRKTVGHLDNTLQSRVLPDLLDVRERMARIEGKLDTLWSPRQRKPASRSGMSTKRTAGAR